MRVKPYLLPLLQFTLLGPGIGVLVFAFLGSAGMPSPAALGLVLLFGYGIGIVPAALAGVIYVFAWNARKFLKVLSVNEFGALLGAISGVAAQALFAVAMSRTPAPKSGLVYFIPLVAGAVCGWLAAQARDEAYGWIDASRNVAD